MSNHVDSLAFGLMVALVFPIIVYGIGVLWSKLIGGWRNPNIQRWWTTFCLAMPFVFLGMMATRMAEDNFDSLRVLWGDDRPILIAAIAIVALAVVVLVLAIKRVWRAPRATS
jgi:hypothetical protein